VVPTKRELLELREKILLETNIRAQTVSRQIAGATTTAIRFELLDQRKLEALILSAIWLYESPAELGQLVPIIGKNCGD